MSIKRSFSTSSFYPTVALALAFFTSSVSIGQDEGQSSRRESEAIKNVENAGGRVHKISAADNSLELSFYLSSKPITNEQLKGVNAIGEVIWVNLAGTKVTDEGLKHLVGMPIKKLHLERTKIGDEGLKHVAELKDLKYLNVYDTKVSDAGLEYLKELKNLEKLFVWKSAVTEAGIKKLNESLPDLKIVGELKLEPVVVEEPKEEAAKAEGKKPEETKKDPKANKAEGKKVEPKKENPTKDKSSKSDKKD